MKNISYPLAEMILIHTDYFMNLLVEHYLYYIYYSFCYSVTLIRCVNVDFVYRFLTAPTTARIACCRAISLP